MIIIPAKRIKPIEEIHKIKQRNAGNLWLISTRENSRLRLVGHGQGKPIWGRELRVKDILREKTEISWLMRQDVQTEVNVSTIVRSLGLKLKSGPSPAERDSTWEMEWNGELSRDMLHSLNQMVYSETLSTYQYFLVFLYFIIYLVT